MVLMAQGRGVQGFVPSHSCPILFRAKPNSLRITSLADPTLLSPVESHPYKKQGGPPLRRFLYHQFCDLRLPRRKVFPCPTHLPYPSNCLWHNAATISMAAAIAAACSPPTPKRVCARTTSAACRPSAPRTTKLWPNSSVPSRTFPLPPASISFSAISSS